MQHIVLAFRETSVVFKASVLLMKDKPVQTINFRSVFVTIYNTLSPISKKDRVKQLFVLTSIPTGFLTGSCWLPNHAGAITFTYICRILFTGSITRKLNYFSNCTITELSVKMEDPGNSDTEPNVPKKSDSPVEKSRDGDKGGCLQEGASLSTQSGPEGADGPKGLSRRAKKRLRRERLRKLSHGSRAKKTKLSDEQEYNIITKEAMAETSYYFENGLRKVYPYYFTFSTYAKGRWCGRTVMDIFQGEFGSLAPQYHRKAIENGLVKVNGEMISPDYVFKENDFLTNEVHRHEMPVTDEPIEILVNNEQVLVVNKPSSIPVHPCGRFRHNSLTYILSKEYNMHNIRSMYRLDRLTSGLLIFSRSDKLTKQMQHEITSRLVHKEYVCRVAGEFPQVDMECSEPIGILCFKMGIFKVGPSGKEASTKFERLSFNGKTSVVKCQPLTGRTHQIRVHLQYLGYPIVNDPIYNHEVWGPERGTGGRYGKPEDQLIEELLTIHSSEQYLQKESPSGETDNGCNTEHFTDPTTDDLSNSQQNPEVNISGTEEASPTDIASLQNTSFNDTTSDEEISKPEKNKFDKGKTTVEKNCYYCQTHHRPPSPKELVMFLHAYRYKGESWDYSTPLPSWAAEDWSDGA